MLKGVNYSKKYLTIHDWSYIFKRIRTFVRIK